MCLLISTWHKRRAQTKISILLGCWSSVLFSHVKRKSWERALNTARFFFLCFCHCYMWKCKYLQNVKSIKQNSILMKWNMHWKPNQQQEQQVVHISKHFDSFIMSIECFLHIHILFVLVPNLVLSIFSALARTTKFCVTFKQMIPFECEIENKRDRNRENGNCLAFVFASIQLSSWGYNYILALLDFGERTIQNFIIWFEQHQPDETHFENTGTHFQIE